MCFSAPASFIASGFLGTAGVATLTQKITRRELPFALVPFFFGLQQAAEGIIWISASGSLLSTIAMYTFLAFAFIIWPVYIPWAIMLLEKGRARKMIFYLFLIIGAAVSIYHLYFFITTPKSYQIVNHSIQYIVNVPQLKWTAFLYVAATCGAPLHSSHKWIILFGLVLTISLIVAVSNFAGTAISVWCFFGAILSAIIFMHFRTRRAS